jgi:hypothetical protein
MSLHPSCKESWIMPADSPSPTIAAPLPEHRSLSSTLAPVAGSVAAGMLLAGSAISAYWGTAGASGAAASFRPLVPHLAFAALCFVAAALLLACIGVLAAPWPRWMLREGPRVLTVLFASAALAPVFTAPRDLARNSQLFVGVGLYALLAALCEIVARAERPQ